MSYSPLTNLGSKIDPDADRDQAVDREREAEEIRDAKRAEKMMKPIFDMIDKIFSNPKQL